MSHRNWRAVAAAAALAAAASLLPAAPAQAAPAATTLTYSGPQYVAYRRPAALSATLTSAGAPVAGRTVSFKVDVGGQGQACSGVTDAAGKVACTAPRIGLASQDTTVTATFAGDAAYAAAAAVAPVLSYEWFTGGGFVVSDLAAGTPTPVVGNSVTLYDPNWTGANPLAAGPTSAFFRGFQTSDSEPRCGGDWKVYEPNFAGPLPTGSPTYTVAAVTSAVKVGYVKTQGTTALAAQGDIVHVVIVANTWFSGNPDGNTAGSIVGVLC